MFGGSGTLGKELARAMPNIIRPKRSECDVVDIDDVLNAIDNYSPDIIIHAAAMTDNRIVESSPIKAIHANIIGTANVAMACIERNVRLVYLSTDYVYKGDRGNYREDDEILPFNKYAWTKLGGECSVMNVKNHLIIRTSFGKNKFEYREAFIDKWSSKEYVDMIVPEILAASLSPLTGVLNLGGPRRSLFSYASERTAAVSPVRIRDTNYFTPYDTSLNLQKWIDYRSSETLATPHLKCRVCDSEKMTKYLDLGLMPLANNLEATAELAKKAERFPLQVMFCNSCGLSQLSLVVNPEKMFSHYAYRSSVNGGYVDHCSRMAETMAIDYGVNENSFHIDIAGNDGTLLDEFRKVLGHKVLNVDPAANLAAIAESKGIECIVDFWGAYVAQRIQAKADIITATNVFAHLDNVKDFISACRDTLKPNGILVIENPYLIDFIENMEFDTVYFEHVTYWSLLPMLKLCRGNGMKVLEANKQDIHGGTMRYIIARDDSNYTPLTSSELVSKNEIALGYATQKKYGNWAGSVDAMVKLFRSNLLVLKLQGNSIAGFAASAKGNTLLNCAEINTDIMSFIVDQTPEKIGKFSPGTGIPIVGFEQIAKKSPDYIVILSWNFKDEIMNKIRETGWTGKFIIPIPQWEVVD